MLKKYTIKYSIEFVVIILGISVSFWLNELSIQNQDEKERIKVLSSLQLEINEIKFYCNEKKQTWTNDIRLLNEFLAPVGGKLNTNRILNIIHPEPVPISRIFLFLFFLKFFKTFSIISSVSGLGIRTLGLVMNFCFQNSLYPSM